MTSLKSELWAQCAMCVTHNLLAPAPAAGSVATLRKHHQEGSLTTLLASWGRYDVRPAHGVLSQHDSLAFLFRNLFSKV